MSDTHFSGVDTLSLKQGGIPISLARGLATVTGYLEVDTGLDTVVAVLATLYSDPSLTAYWVSADISVTPGHITLRVWKPTSAADVTPLNATSAVQVSWLAIGST